MSASGSADWLEMTVNSLVQRYPDAMSVLHRFNIDLCCGGWMTLRRAAEDAGADKATVLAALQEVLERADDDRPAVTREGSA